MRLIASAYSQRLAAFSRYADDRGAGFPGFALSAWLGLVIPAGTPKERVERLSALCAKIVQSPEIGQKYATLGAIQRTSTPEEFRVFLAAEHARWGAVVKAVGAKVD